MQCYSTNTIITPCMNSMHRGATAKLVDMRIESQHFDSVNYMCGAHLTSHTHVHTHRHNGGGTRQSGGGGGGCYSDCRGRGLLSPTKCVLLHEGVQVCTCVSPDGLGFREVCHSNSLQLVVTTLGFRCHSIASETVAQPPPEAC